MAIWKRIRENKERFRENEERRAAEENLVTGDDGKPEKGDIPAMLISAFLTIWLPIALILLAVAGLLLLIF